MFADGTHAHPDGKWHGEDLFWYCQRLAETKYPATSGQGKRPSGALIYYVVRLVMLRLYPGAVIEPDAAPVPQDLAERFMALAPQVAKRLAAELKSLLRLLDYKQAGDELQRLMYGFARLTLPRLNWAVEHHVGIYGPLRQHLQSLWVKFWEEARVEQVKLLLRLRQHPEYLLVRQVAPPAMSGKAALKRLRKELAQDKSNPIWATPSPGCYLYDEPLRDWMLRPLLSGQLFIDLCKIMAELTLAVPALARKRSADLGVPEDDPQTPSTDTLKQELRRRLPIRPQGTATQAAIAFYALAAWRVARPTPHAPAHPSGGQSTKSDEPAPPDPAQLEDSGNSTSAEPAADADLVLPDERTMPFSQFQRLLECAMKAAEYLLWDDTQALRALPTPSPEQRLALRHLLLSERLRRQYDALRQKERQRAGPTQTALPGWIDWETWRDARGDEMALRLAQSIAPAAITSATLPDLLRLPTTALVGQYLYQMPFGAWLRAELQGSLLNGHTLLRWCYALAEALANTLGAWPPNTPGAPRTIAQAALAACWYTKLALEARIDRLPGFSAPPDLPQRADGGLVVWLDTLLPVEALELATVIAPLVTRVMYHCAKEAASQGQALFVALIKKREPRSFHRLREELRQRAADLNLPNSDDAVQQAFETLETLLEHLLLPDEIALEHLMGEQSLLISLDFIIDYHYNILHKNYQFIGDFKSFVRSFVRPPDARDAKPGTLPTQVTSDELAVRHIAPDPVAENAAALELLELLLHNAQTPQGGELARDALQLIEWAFTTNTGRTLIEQFAKQGQVVAIELIQFWQASLLPREGAARAISPRQEKKQMKQQAALGRILVSPAVQGSPALRRAVADLFELPVGITTPQLLGPRLGELERLTSWVTRKALRAEALRILSALEQVSPTQRGALSARLLAEKQFVLTLYLLQQRGWSRPSWFRTEEETYSPQIFQYARQSWQRRLAESDTTWRARALMAEWLCVQFWSPVWSAPLHTKYIAQFHQTLLRALPPRLHAALVAASLGAWEQKLASFLEVLGVEGCLPPQLPAQLDDQVYFEAMWDSLTVDEQRLYDAPEDGEPDEELLTWLREDWQIARLRTHLWFLVLAGLADENEQRILLAAMSLANGDARLVGRWIAGQQPTPKETEDLLTHLKHWNPQSTLTEHDIPNLLSRAAERVHAAWEAVGATAFL